MLYSKESRKVEGGVKNNRQLENEVTDKIIHTNNTLTVSRLKTLVKQQRF